MLLRLILFSLFFLKLSAYSQQEETSSEISKSEQSVWKLNRNDSFCGSGFFISPKLFITNAHVLKHSQLQNITLTHEKQTETLTIKKLIALDLKLDLALLEIKEESLSHLLFKEEPINKEEKLFILGYPKKTFNILQKVGLLRSFSETEQHFPVNRLNLQGASGGPILDTQDRITGVLWGKLKNIALVVSQNSLQEFIKGDSGVICSDNEQPKVFSNCFLKALAHLFKVADLGDPQAQYIAYEYNKKTELLKSAAEQGLVIAQYDLAFVYLYGIGVHQNEKTAVYWLEQSAKSGFVPAQYDLAEIYLKKEEVDKNKEVAFYWMEKSAKNGHAPAQYKLALMYRDGIAVQKNKEKAFYWIEKSAKNGYASTQ